MNSQFLMKVSIGILLAVTAVYLYLSFGRGGSVDLEIIPKNPNEIRVTSEILAKHPIQTAKMKEEGDFEEVFLPGTVSYDLAKMARVGSRVTGRIVNIFVNEGDYVQKGQRVFAIQSVELGEMEAMYKKALARKEALMIQAERAKELYEKKVTSAKEYEMAMMEFKTVKTELETSRSALENFGLSPSEIESLSTGVSFSLNLPIRSPITGTVTERNAVLGQAVSVRDNLFTVADLSTLWIMLEVYEKDLNQIKIGAIAEVVPYGEVSGNITAKVSHVGEVVDPVKRSAEVRLLVKNAKGKLRPGQTISATVQGLVPQTTEKKKFFTIPQVAVHKIEGESLVFVKISDDTFLAKKIETGKSVDDRIEIISGLELNDEVVTEGSFLLKSEYLRI
jgi:cobalt-zinc-cadmium efflux system membrane fusion protein